MAALAEARRARTRAGRGRRPSPRQVERLAWRAGLAERELRPGARPAPRAGGAAQAPHARRAPEPRGRRVKPVATALDPAAFADRYLPRNEKGQRWALHRYQRRGLASMFRRHFALRLWSEVKKSGKTFLAAVLGLWWAYTHAKTEVIVAANDLEQSVSRVFKTMADLLAANPELGASAAVRAQEITLSNGTTIRAIASEYRGAAGSRHSLVIFDELWGYDSERAQRLYEELTPPPTEPDAWVLVVTYAGFIGESTLLEAMYQRGLAGTRVDDELELYEADGLAVFWSHTPRQPWQTPAYYAEQARSLAPDDLRPPAPERVGRRREHVPDARAVGRVRRRGPPAAAPRPRARPLRRRRRLDGA